MYNVRYISEFKLPEYDADIITEDKKMADFFEEAISLGGEPKKISNYLLGEVKRLLNENNTEFDKINLNPLNLVKLIKIQEEGKINSTIAKEVFEKMYYEDVEPLEYIKEHSLMMESNEDELKDIVQKVIDENEKSVEDYRNGKEKALGFLVGQTMKVTKGKANPGMINKLLKELLSDGK